MYAVWTFDLDSRAGLGAFLDWTRAISMQRLDELAAKQTDELTWARWKWRPTARGVDTKKGGAPSRVA